MPKFYTRVMSVNLSDLRRTKTTYEEASTDRVVNEVYKKVVQNIKSGKIDLEPDNEERKHKKRRKGWITSILGTTMYSKSIISNSIRMAEATNSTDSAQLAQNAYTAVKGVGTLTLSTFGGPLGAVTASIFGFIDGLVGQSIKNQIQLSYDNSRLWYNLTRNDIGRNSTYTYDYEQQKWVARDTERVKKNILNQNSSV